KGALVGWTSIWNQGVLVPIEGAFKTDFFHESIYEFFAVRRLAEDFEAVSSPETFAVDHLKSLQLAKVELDYLQSSAYGFLVELLGDSCSGRLADFLGRTDLESLDWKLLRNLVEYIGMSYQGGPDEVIIIRLLEQIMKHEGLVARVRYNAARALERIHPQAPRPYFDFVSDWGGRDWRNEWESIRQLDRHPQVMRGYKKEQSEARTHSGFLPNSTHRMSEELTSMQRTVSRSIHTLLKPLLETPTPDRFPLRINFSWAWIRWFHPDHEPERLELEKLAREEFDRQLKQGLPENEIGERRTLKNLRDFVGKAPYSGLWSSR
ncbi:MAG: hypothetical protein AAF492_23835, partial [Verrucomicrobiota bacterium]